MIFVFGCREHRYFTALYRKLTYLCIWYLDVIFSHLGISHEDFFFFLLSVGLYLPSNGSDDVDFGRLSGLVSAASHDTVSKSDFLLIRSLGVYIDFPLLFHTCLCFSRRDATETTAVEPFPCLQSWSGFNWQRSISDL